VNDCVFEAQSLCILRFAAAVIWFYILELKAIKQHCC